MSVQEKLYLIRVIYDSMDEFYKEPSIHMDSKRFKEASLYRWAYREVIDLIIKSDDPLKDLALLSLRTSKWMMSKNMKMCETFAVLNEAVEFSMDLINGMQ